MRSFWSIDGARTEGDCRPSRSVSSLSSTTGGFGAGASRFQSKTRSSTPRPPRDDGRTAQSDGTDEGAPQQAAAHRVANGGPHHLVDAHCRTLTGQRRALGRYISAGAGTDFVVLYSKEHDERGSERGDNETDSHASIIGRR